MQNNLHTLRMTAFEAGKDHYAARSQYFNAVNCRSSDRETKQALDQCIVTGEQYRTALKMYLDELRDMLTIIEVEDAAARAERLLDLLGLELQKFFALRARQ